MYGAQGGPPQYGMQQAGWGYLDITLDYFPLQWIKSFVTPTIEIDGYPAQKPWGRHVVPLAPGNHHVRVHYPYLFISQSGLAARVVPIYAGMATMARYEAPWFSFSGGTLNVLSTRPA